MPWQDNRSDRQHGWGQPYWRKASGQWEEVPSTSFVGGGQTSSSAGPAYTSRQDAAWTAHREVVTDEDEAESDFVKLLMERITELRDLRDIPNRTGRDKETLSSPEDAPTCVGFVNNHYDEQARVMATRTSRNPERKIEMPPLEALVAIGLAMLHAVKSGGVYLGTAFVFAYCHLLKFSLSSAWEELARHEGVGVNALTHAFFVDADQAVVLLLIFWRSSNTMPLIDVNQGHKLMVLCCFLGRVKVKLPSSHDVPAFVGLVKIHVGSAWEELARHEGVGANALRHACADKAVVWLIVWRSFNKMPLIDVNQGHKLMGLWCFLGRVKVKFPSSDGVPAFVGLVKIHGGKWGSVCPVTTFEVACFRLLGFSMTLLLGFFPISVWEEITKHEGVDANALTPAFFVDADKAFDLLLSVGRALDKKPSIDVNQGQKHMEQRFPSGRGKVSKHEGVDVNALTHANRKTLSRTTKQSRSSSSAGPAGISQGRFSEPCEQDVDGGDVTSDGA
jgi:hypothetical protein